MAKPKYIEGKEPHPREMRMIFRNVDRQGWDQSIETYIKDGGYKMAEKALKKMEPSEITNEVKASGLRGRGGAGFPTGVKWGFIPPNNTKPVYLICNADESEPGTFKDRYILHQDPHQLLEGMIISCFATGANTAYIYIREEFPEAAKIVEAAIAEAKKKKYLGKKIFGTKFDLEIYVHRGAGAYICGEETGLIESLEGKRPYPRIKPPYFPAALGPLHVPDDRQQRGVAVPREAHHRDGRREVQQDRHASQHRDAHPLCQRRRGEPRLLRSRGRQDHYGASSSTTSVAV